MTSTSRVPWNCPSLVAVLRALVLFVGCHLVGCHAVFEGPPAERMNSILRPVQSSPDSVSLEVMQARVSADQSDQLRAIWSNADETRLDADVRARLAADGFRAGVISQAIPQELSKLLLLESQSTDPNAEQVITAQAARQRVSRQTLHLKRHEESQVVASELRQQLSLLFSHDGGARGKTYRTVQPVYSLSGHATDGQRVIVQLTPELHHGEVRDRYTGDHGIGMIIKRPSRDREVFDQLRLSAELEPGELLILGTSGEAHSTLGHAFHHTESSGKEEVKLVVIRAGEVPPSQLFARAD